MRVDGSTVGGGGFRVTWRRTPKRSGNVSLPNTYFGKSSSPLVTGGLIVVTGGLAKKSSVLAFHSADGSSGIDYDYDYDYEGR